MNTTAMFIEIVVVGAQVVVSLSAFVFALWGLPPAPVVAYVMENPMVSIIVAAPWIYLSGIVGDRLADIVGQRFLEPAFMPSIGQPWRSDERKRLECCWAPAILRLAHWTTTVGVSGFCDQLFWNVPLTVIGVFLLLVVWTSAYRWDIAAVGLATGAAVFLAYRHMSLQYIGVVLQMDKTLRLQKP